MTNETLRALALQTKPLVDGSTRSLNAFYSAMSPDRTLALLDDIQALTKRVNDAEQREFKTRIEARTTFDNMKAENAVLFMANQASVARGLQLLDENVHLKDRDAYNTDIIQRFGVKVERLRTLLQASTDALCMPCDRWNKEQSLIVNQCVEANNLELSK